MRVRNVVSFGVFLLTVATAQTQCTSPQPFCDPGNPGVPASLDAASFATLTCPDGFSGTYFLLCDEDGSTSDASSSACAEELSHGDPLVPEANTFRCGWSTQSSTPDSGGPYSGRVCKAMSFLDDGSSFEFLLATLEIETGVLTDDLRATASLLPMTETETSDVLTGTTHSLSALYHAPEQAQTLSLCIELANATSLESVDEQFTITNYTFSPVDRSELARHCYITEQPTSQATPSWGERDVVGNNFTWTLSIPRLLYETTVVFNSTNDALSFDQTNLEGSYWTMAGGLTEGFGQFCGSDTYTLNVPWDVATNGGGLTFTGAADVNTLLYEASFEIVGRQPTTLSSGAIATELSQWSSTIVMGLGTDFLTVDSEGNIDTTCVTDTSYCTPHWNSILWRVTQSYPEFQSVQQIDTALTLHVETLTAYPYLLASPTVELTLEDGACTASTASVLLTDSSNCTYDSSLSQEASREKACRQFWNVTVSPGDGCCSVEGTVALSWSADCIQDAMCYTPLDSSGTAALPNRTLSELFGFKGAPDFCGVLGAEIQTTAAMCRISELQVASPCLDHATNSLGRQNDYFYFRVDMSSVAEITEVTRVEVYATQSWDPTDTLIAQIRHDEQFNGEALIWSTDEPSVTFSDDQGTQTLQLATVSVVETDKLYPLVSVYLDQLAFVCLPDELMDVAIKVVVHVSYPGLSSDGRRRIAQPATTETFHRVTLQPREPLQEEGIPAGETPGGLDLEIALRFGRGAPDPRRALGTLEAVLQRETGALPGQILGISSVQRGEDGITTRFRIHPPSNGGTVRSRRQVFCRAPGGEATKELGACHDPGPLDPGEAARRVASLLRDQRRFTALPILRDAVPLSVRATAPGLEGIT